MKCQGALSLFRVNHHSWGGECSACSHRGCSEEGTTHNQQCHANRGQEEVLVNAFNIKGNLPLVVCFFVDTGKC